MTDEVKLLPCQHLIHLPSGRCVGCGEQHQPLSDYQPGDDEAFIRERLSEAEATRPTIVTDEVVERLREDVREVAERLSIEAQIAAPTVSEEGRLRAKMGDCASLLFKALAAMPAIVGGE